MEDNLNFFTKWKTNSTFQPNEDNLIFYYKMDDILNFVYNPNGRRAHFCSKIEDDLNVFKIKDDLNFQQSGRQPLFSTKWKTTSIFYKRQDDPNFNKMEDNLDFLQNGRQPQVFSQWM